MGRSACGPLLETARRHKKVKQITNELPLNDEFLLPQLLTVRQV